MNELAYQPLHVNSIPQELLGKIFSELDDRERCSVIPCVCRTWLQIHRDHPPHCKTWRIDSQINAAMVAWFLKIASNLEELEIDIFAENPELIHLPIGCLTQMLGMAAATAPKLRQLTIGKCCIVPPVLRSLAPLSQIRQLTLRGWDFSDHCMEDGLMAIAGLTGLRSLETLRLEVLLMFNSTPRGASFLWQALSTLQKLTSLQLGIFIEDHPYVPIVFLESSFDDLTLLTNLRDLEINSLPGQCLGGGLALPPVFGQLTDLTSLRIMDHLTVAASAPVLGLPKLEDLSLRIMDEEPDRMYIASPRLSRLHILFDDVDCDKPLESVVDLSSPGLPHIQTLRIGGSQVRDFPLPLASRLKSLVRLDLSGCGFTALPPAVASMPALQELDLSRNAVELQDRDLGLLAGLTNLALLRTTGNCADHDYPTSWAYDSACGHRHRRESS